ncbi:TonB-dependent receptor [Cupriavidus gilardii]|uniref:TonB-dependent receptor n=1 Tax=Cupriavidus gilardii TaxID=82541 RepID=UPI0021C041EC|nr:TonB-dependent receptor [Cupriavidus gilardii]MCT9118931.1 TonB-dependent receptor [Cupriavidus gilardii]
MSANRTAAAAGRPRAPAATRRTGSPIPRAIAMACVIALFGAGHAVAQQGSTVSQQDSLLPTVTIVAAAPLPGLGVERDALPYTVQGDERDTASGPRAGNLVEYLNRNLAGVNVNEIQGSPFQADVTYRGFRASSILGVPQGLSVYLDGVRVNEPFGDVVNWDMIPEAALDHIALVSGSNPVYGLNTLGGALALTTKSGLTSQGFGADISYGSGARKRADLSFGARSDDGWHGFAAGTLFKENGWRDQSDGRLGNLFLKAGRSSGATEWDLSLLHGNSRLVGNGLVPDYRLDGNAVLPDLYAANRRAVFTYPDQTRNRVTQATLNGSHWLDDTTRISAMAYVRHSRRDTVNGDVSEDYAEYAEACEDGFNADGSPADDDCGYTREQGAALHPAVLNTTHTRQRGQGAALSLAKELGAHRINMGVTFDANRVRYAQYEQEALLSADRGVSAAPGSEVELFSGAHGKSRAIGVYLADLWALTPTTHLNLSARWNRLKVTSTLIDSDGSDKPTERFTYSKLNPAIGLTQQVGAGLTLFASAAQSNRVPTVIELGCADPAQPCRLPAGLQADPYLKQVVSRTYEVGARWRPLRDLELTGTAYRTDNRDDILFLRAPNSQQGYFSNFDRTRHQGVDLLANWRLDAVTLRLGYSNLQATYQAHGRILAGERTIDVRPGMRLAGLPRHTLKLGADWRVTPSFAVGADVLAVSSSVISGNEDGLASDPRPGRAPDARRWDTAGYATVNLRASYRVSKQLELYARVDNLFDRRHASYGQLAENILPDGRLVQPHVAPQDAATSRFIAPGAPRSMFVGVRYRM